MRGLSNRREGKCGLLCLCPLHNINDLKTIIIFLKKKKKCETQQGVGDSASIYIKQ